MPNSVDAVSRQRRPKLRRTLATVLAVAIVAVTPAVFDNTIAHGAPTPAAPVDTSRPVSPFYNPPSSFPAQRGAVIRTERTSVFTAAPAREGWPLPAEKVLYTSRTQEGSPVAVSGVFIDSAAPWRGKGPRPTVVIAPGTMGQGDQCATSVAFTSGITVDPATLSLSANQEAPSAAAWNLLGARVFVTDHIGLGTPGIHTYVNRIESAHGVLDAARAANDLAGSGPSTPLVFWGYSQGGGATAAAAELQSSYAPELNLKGTWAGGPTADLERVLARIDGALIGGAIGFAINGLAARYPELNSSIDRVASPSGKRMLRTLSSECIGDVIVKQPFLKTTTLTTDGKPLLDHLRSEPTALRVLSQQRIGTVKPTTPVLITSGRNDDTVPHGQARQLALDWCAKGATVDFRTNELPPILPGTTIPGHFGPEIIDAYKPDSVISYLTDRLNDKPISACRFN
ncbi:lipase family protein [Gordonia soli]|uniref:Putative lipase n=1 Tax=Gordonia soli NBRC 108243 TaxID=1223545 RepID=M0QQ58_9ACTN|nr:lipase family protein [Gordonia soli]GAC70356.1 putative lipase [Gordonia soli NBRC 108243]